MGKKAVRGLAPSLVSQPGMPRGWAAASRPVLLSAMKSVVIFRYRADSLLSCDGRLPPGV